MFTIKRKIFKELKEHLQKKEIALIVGPRQAGKTTLMQLLKGELDKNGEGTLFLSLDSEVDRQYFSSQNSLIKKIELEIGKKKGYVFIDEIQRKEDAGIFLKGIYDMNLPYKFIVSGSGSLELKEKIHESLVGRKRVFEMNTVSFEEFVNFKTDYRYEDKLEEYFSLESIKSEDFLSEYLHFGGYPRIILEDSLEEKKKNMDEIFRSYLEKDIVYLLNIERRDAFSTLIRLLSNQIGQMINYSEIASMVNISTPTLKNYLWYAEKTFVIQMVTPYFTNPRKEIVKSQSVYFYDLGLRNFSSGMFGNIVSPKEKGFLFQNLVFSILREKLRFSNASLHFWRTKDKAEVDLVINYGRYVLPVEVKYKAISQVEIPRSLRSFIERHNPSRAFIVNLNFEHTTSLGKTEINFLPFWKIFDKEWSEGTNF